MTEPAEPPKRGPGRPKTGQTPGHNVPMPHDRWQRLGEAANAAGSDRTKVLNRFAAWFTHEPGAKRPERPPIDDAAGE